MIEFSREEYGTLPSHRYPCWRGEKMNVFEKIN